MTIKALPSTPTRLSLTGSGIGDFLPTSNKTVRAVGDVLLISAEVILGFITDIRRGQIFPTMTMSVIALDYEKILSFSSTHVILYALDDYLLLIIWAMPVAIRIEV